MLNRPRRQHPIRHVFWNSCCLAVLLAACTTSQCHSALLAYDGFDYEAGALDLYGSAGDGWSGKWFAGTNYNVASGSLTLPNFPLATVGGHAVGTSTANRDFTEISLDVSATYYLSYLVSYEGYSTTEVTNQWADVHLRDAFTQKTNSGLTSTQAIHLRDAGGPDTSNALGSADTTDPFFIVHKIVIGSGGDQSFDDSLYLRAYSDGADITKVEPTSWDISIPVADIPFNLNKLTLWAGTRSGFIAHYDEIRLATTWEEAVPFASDGLSGDYNGNSVVDAADYTVWRDIMTAGGTTLPNDPTPGTVDESDFLYWRSHFGEALGAGAGSGFSSHSIAGPIPVPEPAGVALLVPAVLLATWQASRVSRSRSKRGWRGDPLYSSP